MRDARTNLDLGTAGCVHLDPDQALAYARSRHLRYFEDGDWKDDPYSDLSRIQRQQEISRRVIARALSSGARSPVRLAALVDVATSAVTRDPFTSVADLMALGRGLRDFDSDRLVTEAPAVVDRVVGGQKVLGLRDGPEDPIFAPYRLVDVAAAPSADPVPSVPGGPSTTVPASPSTAPATDEPGSESTSTTPYDGFRVTGSEAVAAPPYLPGTGPAARACT